MSTQIKAVFNGTDAAELAAISVGDAGVEILDRHMERVFINDESARFGVTSGVDLRQGSYKTLFSQEGRFSPQPLDVGGSVSLTLTVHDGDAPDTQTVLRNKGGRNLTAQQA